MKMDNLFVYCSGGVGTEVMDIAERVNVINKRWKKIAFIDDVRPEQLYYGHDLIRWESFLERYSPENSEIVIANGEPLYRKNIRKKIISAGFSLSTLIDPVSVISQNAVIEQGSIVYPNVCISGGTLISRNSLLYYHATVAHDSRIGEDTVLSISATVAGNCVVGEGCFIGANAVIRESVSIGDWTIISMGSSVYYDAEEKSVYKGNPATKSRENKSFLVFSRKE